MFLLGVYLFIALFFSFLCSIAEAVMLSLSQVYIVKMEQDGLKSGKILNKLKENINKPLVAILTLNTIAHTAGAAGVGAQAIVVFGDTSLAIVSAVLTLLILIFSEIIPKTLGATYWKELAPATAYSLRFLVWFMYPFIKLSEFIIGSMMGENQSTAFSRNELAIISKLSADEGHIDIEEAAILQNLLLLKDTKINRVMTPRTVLFSVSQNIHVEEFLFKYRKVRFTRIPVFDKDPDDIVGFVIRSDLLLAKTRDNTDILLSNYTRKMITLLDDMSLSHAMKELLSSNTQMALVVNEYGTVRGILTLEDIFETLIGREIIDEEDKDIDMQKLAKKVWKNRAKKYGIGDAEDKTK